MTAENFTGFFLLTAFSRFVTIYYKKIEKYSVPSYQFANFFPFQGFLLKNVTS